MSLSLTLTKYSRESSETAVYVYTFDSPLGKITAAANDQFLYLVSFEDAKNLEKKLETIVKETDCKLIEKTNIVLQKFEGELKDYFAGKLKKFTLPLKMIGSEFQRQVWEKLQELPYGSTQTYGDLALALGREQSHARAVGAACGANAHLLVIPCHRVVGSGSKGGFNSGVDRKVWLINHEKKHGT